VLSSVEDGDAWGGTMAEVFGIRNGVRCFFFVGCAFFLSCQPKAAPPPVDASTPPPVASPGFYREGDVICYRPPDFGASMSSSERMVLRGDALAENFRRLRGELDASFHIDAWILQRIESFLMTHPNRIEGFLEAEHRQCRAYALGRITEKQYRRWFESARRGMAREDCSHPPFDLISIYIDVTRPWEEIMTLCKGEEIDIRVRGGRYTLSARNNLDESVWISAEGDPNAPLTDDLPCKGEGCVVGMVIARFTERGGRHQWIPIGREAHFEAEADGTLSFGINDSSFDDNRFYEKDAIMDYLLVEIRPSG